jgi:hypothetical protein
MSLVTARQPRTPLNLEGFGLIDNSDKVGGDSQKLGLAPYEQEGSFSEHWPQNGQPGEGVLFERLVTGVLVQMAKKRTGRERDVVAERAGFEPATRLLAL